MTNLLHIRWDKGVRLNFPDWVQLLPWGVASNLRPIYSSGNGLVERAIQLVAVIAKELRRFFNGAFIDLNRNLHRAPDVMTSARRTVPLDEKKLMVNACKTSTFNVLVVRDRPVLMRGLHGLDGFSRLKFTLYLQIQGIVFSKSELQFDAKSFQVGEVS